MKELPQFRDNPASQVERVAGFKVYRNLLDADAQKALVDACRSIISIAPLVRPVTGWGKPMSVRMTSAGRVGWVIDHGRYRYTTRHPLTDTPWPAIPEPILEVWKTVSGWPELPDSCLVNWYTPEARLGLHQDKDEGKFDAPVVSVSLGDPARFRMGGQTRKTKTVSTVVRSGDVVVMGGEARLAYHGIDRILSSDDSSPLSAAGRINLALRVVSDGEMR